MLLHLTELFMGATNPADADEGCIVSSNQSKQTVWTQTADENAAIELHISSQKMKS